MRYFNTGIHVQASFSSSVSWLESNAVENPEDRVPRFEANLKIQISLGENI